MSVKNSYRDISVVLVVLGEKSGDHQIINRHCQGTLNICTKVCTHPSRRYEDISLKKWKFCSADGVDVKSGDRQSHLLMTLNVCSKFHVRPFSICWFVGQLSPDFAIPGARPLAWLSLQVVLKTSEHKAEMNGMGGNTRGKIFYFVI